MPPAHTLTLLQYRDAGYHEYMADADWRYPKRDYARLYPPMSRYTDWYRAIETAVKDGAVIRRQVCDDLYRRAPLAWQALVHDWGTGWLPAGYLNPDVRREQP